MTTGDIKNNLKKLQKEVQLIKYGEELDLQGLSQGKPSAFLPLYHYAFVTYSCYIAKAITDINIELYGKTDLRFMEGVYKVLREMFNYKPPVTKEQFFSTGFAERKVIMCTEILNMIKAKHRRLAPKPKSRGNSTLTSLHRSSSVPAIDTQKLTGNPKERKNKENVTECSIPKVVNEVWHRETLAEGQGHEGSLSPPGGVTRTSPSARLPSKEGAPHDALPVISHVRPAEVIGAGCDMSPSINYIRPASVELVTIERGSEVSANWHVAEQPLEPIDVVAMTPGKQPESQDSLTLNQIEETTDNIKNVVSQLYQRMEQMETALHSMATRTPPANREQDDKENDFYITKPQWDSVMARLILLENRVMMLENDGSKKQSNKKSEKLGKGLDTTPAPKAARTPLSDSKVYRASSSTSKAGRKTPLTQGKPVSRQKLTISPIKPAGLDGNLDVPGMVSPKPQQAVSPYHDVSLTDHSAIIEAVERENDANASTPNNPTVDPSNQHVMVTSEISAIALNIEDPEIHDQAARINRILQDTQNMLSQPTSTT
ncbi:uncharacterized protein LOC106178818 isoform X2 [Lingula anatina]|uniref:Centrosomal protein of 44 kDa n=1 Tax=Lingula anatina TaxID=7574 RepID=A0A1S3K538_LINAN|nr:uncharacterized protein LOC106178818 isoform X1 [Lingula anatina]XP_023933186.1 uncharacterized protein LOC106178818 isoform X1 [Lingula anatina]XP_023933187.1 uncharacterized protein LOC106178818 isoform X2 [Lingula anatina]|eukprot:XP_013417622.1 uncharacterized protein LOC106178818 isoform X1 [Lingula anatina]